MDRENELLKPVHDGDESVAIVCGSVVNGDDLDADGDLAEEADQEDDDVESLLRVFVDN
ncbi:hypothetical protein PI124_g6916 [Phytophthora idaei]|nr:hypothetical protein PI125_g6564 [Phytophthora idaei]KAG3163112.1 hypothetical protein PI126_g5668 [Phytophthora idaei]KAG3248400.1 hypothetical protein PI124_g6916 [Phytophthora idaei]